MMTVEEIKNLIFNQFLLKKDFVISDVKIWFINGDNFIREYNKKRDIISIEIYDEYNNGQYRISIDYGIRFEEVEDQLSLLMENVERSDTEITMRSDRKNGSIYSKPFDLNSGNVDNILLGLNDQLEAKAFPYFEEYLTLQDVNNKLLPLQSISEMTSLPRYSNAFLRDYTTEKAMITLKICQNPNLEKYLNWYRAIVEKKITQPKETWKKDYNVFQELDRTFLSK